MWGSFYILGMFSLLSYVAYIVILIWMLIDCVQREQDRGIWIWVMLLLHPLGLIAYFFARYLPRRDLRWLYRWLARFRTRELRLLEIASRQIGNAYHWIQLGEKQRELHKYSDAVNSFREALSKEADNLQANWGLAISLEKTGELQEALGQVEEILEVQPDYKFGDVSLARGRLLMELDQWSAAESHLRTHVDRWRQPEGLYRLAVCLHHDHQDLEAQEQIQSLLMDIDASPTSIARQQRGWKRKAQQLHRQLSG